MTIPRNNNIAQPIPRVKGLKDLSLLQRPTGGIGSNCRKNQIQDNLYLHLLNELFRHVWLQAEGNLVTSYKCSQNHLWLRFSSVSPSTRADSFSCHSQTCTAPDQTNAISFPYFYFLFFLCLFKVLSFSTPTPLGPNLDCEIYWQGKSTAHLRKEEALSLLQLPLRLTVSGLSPSGLGSGQEGLEETVCKACMAVVWC